MGQLDASQQPNEPANHRLERWADELEDFIVVNFVIKQTKHQRKNHTAHHGRRLEQP